MGAAGAGESVDGERGEEKDGEEEGVEIHFGWID